MTKDYLDKIQKIHFVGIGGIGMSALARYFLRQGKKVSGSDEKQSELVQKLKNEGVQFFEGHHKENVKSDLDLVIYTAAVPIDNNELVEAKILNIPAHTYAEILGKITAEYKTIAVSGTHGKTTTTAMLVSALRGAGQKPHAIVGSLIKDEDVGLTNYVCGEDDFFVVEACEYKKSFLNLNPFVAVITNIEEDHLDFYSDLADIQMAFREFVLKVPENGAVVCDISDPNLAPVIDGLKCVVVDYRQFLEQVPVMKVFGEHNVLNAGAVLGAINFLKKDLDGAKLGLGNFSGTWRRSEFVRETENGNLIFDDYAHHPSEIKTTLKGFREHFPDKKINVIFQPHLYSRTKEHFEEFVESLILADQIILMPIYAAREKFDSTVSSEDLSVKIKNLNGNVTVVKNFEEVKEWFNNADLQRDNQVFISMGAGDVNLMWK